MCGEHPQRAAWMPDLPRWSPPPAVALLDAPVTMRGRSLDAGVRSPEAPMRWYQSVGSIVVLMMTASVAVASAAVGPEASGALLEPSPVPSTCIVVQTDPPCPTDTIYLTGQVVGEYQLADWPMVQTQNAARATMDITLTVEPQRVTVAGAGSVDGAYTGNCQFSDSGSGPISWDSNDPSLQDSVVYAAVLVADPRLVVRPLSTIVLSVSAHGTGRGGTCGHAFGYVEDASLSIDVPGCMVEVSKVDQVWHGECQEGKPGKSWVIDLTETAPSPG
jgi:hypothetical protein